MRMTSLNYMMKTTAVFFTAIVCVAGNVLGGTADVSIETFDGPDPVRVNQDLTYSLAITNAGPDSAANVIVTDPLPADVSFVSCAVSQGTWSNDSGTIRCQLGTLVNGATALVTVVVTPARDGVITNEPSVSTDDSDPDMGDNRSAEETVVNEENRAPEIALPAPYSVPVGSTAAFAVVVSDDNHDPVSQANMVAPVEATFVNSNFSWIVGVSYENTTNLLTFVADDGQGETNSVVTNSTTVIVPYDYDTDGIRDGWEWTHFQSLTNVPGGDNDGDGADNYTEYVSGTQPTNSDSCFKATMGEQSGGAGDHYIGVSTEPGLVYTIEYADGPLTNGMGWSPFANTGNGIGSWAETNVVPATYIFHDDEGGQTTGGSPEGGTRFYRIKVERP